MQTSEDLRPDLERALTRALNRGWHKDVLLHFLRRLDQHSFQLCESLLAGRPCGSVHPGAANRLLRILESLQPIPKADLHRFEPASGADSRVTEKVRALIAKAEATTFPEEAEAFMAKAQELITRHAIDEVTLSAGANPAPSEIVVRHVLLEDPYLKPKYVLLAGVAEANRCRAVLLPGYGFATVFGAPSDVEAVEMLFTSLLAQATSFMLTAGRGQGRRTKSFRHAFLLAFSGRISQRLAEATADAVHEAPREQKSSLPALVERERAATAAAGEAFPETRSFALSASNTSGVVAGREAANRASLGHRPVGRRSAALPSG